MIERFKLNLQEFCQINPAERLLVGVSGGPDSLALLRLLCELGTDLIAAHVNHQLRPEANEEERGVQQLAQTWNIPFVSIKVDVNTFAKQNALSIEEAARIVRYRYLFEQAVEWRAKAVAVAHTAEDQIETFLMHLLRGSGLQGLAGMRWRSLPNEWSSEIPLVRPMLSIWRSEVLDYLKQKEIKPYWDKSNLDERYSRNRIRTNLIPYLESFNPAIRKTIWQTCDLVHADIELLESLEDDAIEKVILEEGDGYVEVSEKEFKKIPIAMKRRIVRRICKIVSPETDIEYQHVKRILEFFNRGQQRTTLLTESICLANELGRLYICKPGKLPSHGFYQIYDEKRFNIPIPGSIQIGENLFITAELISLQRAWMYETIKTSSPDHAWVDFDRCSGGLFVRGVEPGDRFAPLQMGGQHVKVSDIYINRKIPKRYRPNYPIICDEDQVLWIPGYTISHYVRVDSETKRVLHLSIERG